MKRDKRRRILIEKRGRCSGHCCSNFYLPFSPEEIEAKYVLWTKFQGSGDKTNIMSMSVADQFQGCDTKTPIDIHLIFPMLSYLGQDVMPRQVRRVEPDPDRHYYSCKHWDQETGDCTIYEHRPQMCREYPYRGKCNYAACTWKSKKQKPSTPKERAAERRLLKADGLLDEAIAKPKGRRKALYDARKRKRH